MFRALDIELPIAKVRSGRVSSRRPSLTFMLVPWSAVVWIREPSPLRANDTLPGSEPIAIL